MTLTRIAVAAALVPLLLLLGCGGDGESNQAETYSRDSVADCLREAGAEGVTTREADAVPGEVAAEGAVEGNVDGLRFALAFEPDEETAATTGETLYTQITGGSEQRRIQANDMVRRSANVVIAYERPPNVKQSEIVAGCLGGADALENVAS